jgi:hypothetical protein
MVRCPRCNSDNVEVARFCGHCGLALALGPAGALGAGRVRHPDGLCPPHAAKPVGAAADLHYWSEVVGGGAPLLGTESLVVHLFNGGYGLANVTLRVCGRGRAGESVCTMLSALADWPRGRTETVEVPSWELSGPLALLSVELVTAEFGAES